MAWACRVQTLCVGEDFDYPKIFAHFPSTFYSHIFYFNHRCLALWTYFLIDLAVQLCLFNIFHLFCSIVQLFMVQSNRNGLSKMGGHSIPRHKSISICPRYLFIAIWSQSICVEAEEDRGPSHHRLSIVVVVSSWFCINSGPRRHIYSSLPHGNEARMQTHLPSQ